MKRKEYNLIVTNEYGSDRGNQYINVWFRDEDGNTFLWRTTWKTKLYAKYGMFLTGDKISCIAAEIPSTLTNVTELTRLNILSYHKKDS